MKGWGLRPVAGYCRARGTHWSALRGPHAPSPAIYSQQIRYLQPLRLAPLACAQPSLPLSGSGPARRPAAAPHAQSGAARCLPAQPPRLPRRPRQAPAAAAPASGGGACHALLRLCRGGEAGGEGRRQGRPAPDDGGSDGCREWVAACRRPRRVLPCLLQSYNCLEECKDGYSWAAPSSGEALALFTAPFPFSTPLPPRRRGHRGAAGGVWHPGRRPAAGHIRALPRAAGARLLAAAAGRLGRRRQASVGAQSYCSLVVLVLLPTPSSPAQPRAVSEAPFFCML